MYTVFIAENEAQIVRASDSKSGVNLLELVTIDIKEDLVQNGVIIDENGFLKLLESMKKRTGGKLRSCGLVVDSSLIYSKKLELPKLKNQEMDKLIRNEFIHIETEQDKLLIDYTSIKVQPSAVENERGLVSRSHALASGGRRTAIVAYAMRRSLIDAYIALFKKSNIKLEFIDVSLNAFLHLMEKNKSFGDKNVIAAYLSKYTMTSIMLDHGRFIFSNRMGIASDRGSGEFSGALLQSLTSLLRFYQTQNNQDPLDAIYIGGLDESQRQLCENLTRILEVDIIPGIPIEGLKIPSGLKDTDMDSLIYALGSVVER